MKTSEHTILEDATVFAERVKECKVDQRMTTEELSRLSYLGRNTIDSYISRSKPRIPQLTNAMAIAKALGVSLDYLCGINVEKKLPDQKELSADTLLLNLFIAARDANLEIIADPATSTTTFTSKNVYVSLFFSRLMNSISTIQARELAEKYSHYGVINGQIIEPEVYKEIVNQQRIFCDIEDEDVELYPEETQQLIDERKSEGNL